MNNFFSPVKITHVKKFDFFLIEKRKIKKRKLTKLIPPPRN
jgi:hypothetical protein